MPITEPDHQRNTSKYTEWRQRE